MLPDVSALILVVIQSGTELQLTRSEDGDALDGLRLWGGTHPCCRRSREGPRDASQSPHCARHAPRGALSLGNCRGCEPCVQRRERAEPHSSGRREMFSRDSTLVDARPSIWSASACDAVQCRGKGDADKHRLAPLSFTHIFVDCLVAFSISRFPPHRTPWDSAKVRLQ